MAVRTLAPCHVKPLLRLYPRSWRRRYGREMEVLLEDMPSGVGLGLDLVLGAGAAYAAVIRGNRILSTAGAYLHGVCVAVLLQAIGFVSFVLVAETSRVQGTTLDVGPMHLLTYARPFFLGLRPSFAAVALSLDWLPAASVLTVLVMALVFLLAAPRLARSTR